MGRILTPVIELVDHIYTTAAESVAPGAVHHYPFT